MKNVRDYSNLTNEELVLDEALREDVLKDLGDDILAKSDVWKIGTKFEMFVPGFMINENIVDLFDSKITTVNEFLSDANQDRRDELIATGSFQISNKLLTEFVKFINSSISNNSQQNGIAVFLGNVEIAKILKELSISNNSQQNGIAVFLERIANAGIQKDEEKSTNVRGYYTINGKEFSIGKPMWIHPLSSVSKFGMFMTGTPKAIEFRDRIVGQLKIDVAKTQAIKNVNRTSHNTIKSMIANGAVPSISDFKEYQEAKSKSAKLVSYSYLKQCTDELRDMRDTLANLRDSLLRVNTSKMKRLDKAEHNEKITKCNTMIEIMSDQIIENQELTENIVKDKLDNIGGKLEYQLSDIIKEHYGAASASKVNECKEKLKMLGIFEIKHPIAQKNKVDKKTGKILRKAGEVNTDIDLYLPTKDFKWINEGKFARISETAASQKFEFSECGKLFIENALFKNLIFKTKDEFINWLLDSEEV